LTEKNIFSEFAARISSIVGSEDIISSGEKLAEYSVDMADFRGKIMLVARPENGREVSELVKLANELRVPLIARGGGSSVTGAVVGDDAIVVDLTRMNRILKIDRVNWYAHVEAGVILDQLNQELDKAGLYFPPDPASSFLCTVGGAVAEGSGGMRCVKFGTFKDWVLALKVVLPNGNIVKIGEALPKNRAGYDLVHLFIGSEGTLGIITEAWLKIIPSPTEKPRRMFVLLDSWENAGKAILTLRQSRVLPSIMEFVDRESLELVNQKMEMTLPVDEAVLLLDVDEKDITVTEKILQESQARKILVARDDDEAQQFYNARAGVYLAIRGTGKDVMVEDVVVPIDMLMDYLQFVKKLGRRMKVEIIVGGHIGDGNVHPVILYDKQNRNSQKAALQAFEEICRYAIKMGGTVTGEHGVGTQKVKFLREQILAHNGSDVLQLMKELKRLFDPKGIMNPGKYVEAC
jgi:glycolate oxidase